MIALNRFSTHPKFNIANKEQFIKKRYCDEEILMVSVILKTSFKLILKCKIPKLTSCIDSVCAKTLL